MTLFGGAGIFVSIFFNPENMSFSLVSKATLLLVGVMIPLSSWFLLFRDVKTIWTKVLSLFRKITLKYIFELFIKLILYIVLLLLFIFLISLITQIPIVETISNFILIAIICVFGISIVWIIIQNIIYTIKDSRKLRGVDFGKDLSWTMLCQTLESFQTDWGRSNYLESVRIHRLSVSDYEYDSKLPKIIGDKSKEQLARLREQILGLQE